MRGGPRWLPQSIKHTSMSSLADMACSRSGELRSMQDPVAANFIAASRAPSRPFPLRRHLLPLLSSSSLRFAFFPESLFFSSPLSARPVGCTRGDGRWRYAPDVVTCLRKPGYFAVDRSSLSLSLGVKNAGYPRNARSLRRVLESFQWG